MATIDGTDKNEMPSRFYSYSHHDLLVRLNEIDLRLAKMEAQQVRGEEEAFTNHLFSYGGFLIAIGLAEYTLSFELPDSHFAQLSLLFGIAGIVMLIISSHRLRSHRQSET
jgi:hypothetical protein